MHRIAKEDHPFGSQRQEADIVVGFHVLGVHATTGGPADEEGAAIVGVVPGPALERRRETPPETRVPEGWYYLRHARVDGDPAAPDGKQVLTFTNDVPGRSARALQALAIDGRAVSSVQVSLWVRGRHVERGTSADEGPRFLVAFFGEDRTPIGAPATFGGWTGTFDWRREEDSIPVPRQARMAIVWIGLLGATGEVSFDHISLIPHGANPSVLPARPAAKKN